MINFKWVSSLLIEELSLSVAQGNTVLKNWCESNSCYINCALPLTIQCIYLHWRIGKSKDKTLVLVKRANEKEEDEYIQGHGSPINREELRIKKSIPFLEKKWLQAVLM